MYIKVRVTPDSKKEVLKEIKSDSFHIAVKEPAKQNRANQRVLELVASFFNISPRQIRIISGHHAPGKILSIPDRK